MKTRTRRFYAWRGALLGWTLEAVGASGVILSMALVVGCLASTDPANEGRIEGFIAMMLLGFSAPIFAKGRSLRQKIIVDLNAFYKYVEATRTPVLLYLREFASDAL